ncbi:hypothetical protein [Streptomyces niveus]|uniref:hypothetical protein n=1 Tax=Streptomyces niveus TaxID=193462 RepID=UPI00344A4BB2
MTVLLTREAVRSPARWVAVGWVAIRIVSLLVMVAGVLAVAAVLSPEKADTAELRRDACGGRTSVVHVLYETPDSVEVRWSVGFLGEKRLAYEFAEMPGLAGGEAQFRKVFAEDLGGGCFQGVFDNKDPLEDFGPLDTLIPVMYWFVVPYAWLRWAILAVWAVLLLDMVSRSRLRAPSAGYWLVASLGLGVGFIAYCWAEPFSLVRKRGTASPGSLSGWGVVGSVASWTVIIGGLAVVVGWLR